MSEEAQVPKRRGGWPKGQPRSVAPQDETPRKKPSLLSKMKARPNWDDDTVGMVMEGEDKLRIPKDIIDQLARDGVALQWITRSVRGKEERQIVAQFERGGWTPVHNTDFDGLLDGLFVAKGSDDLIGVDDCMLVARPIKIHEKARRQERRLARHPLEVKEGMLGHGIDVPGGSHPSATRQNRIERSRERMEVRLDIPE